MASREELATARPHKKCAMLSTPEQRVGGAHSSTTTAASSSRAKFAFGSRLPDAGTSSLTRPKSSSKARIHALTRVRHEHDVRPLINPRKRTRSSSRDSDDSAPKTKPLHRPLTVNAALPLQSSHLPAPMKVQALLSGSQLQTISPSNPVLGQKKKRSTEQHEQERIADLASTEPAFWVKRREKVEAALKELDTIEKQIMAIV